MKTSVQLSLILIGTTLASAIGSALVGVSAWIFLENCDPKLGCTFGIQFMAGLCAIAGLLLGIVLVVGLTGYSSITGKVMTASRSIKYSSASGGLFGAVWSIFVFSKYH